MAKTIKTICIEILMYITIVTMCGHVIAHFWDYYVTRSELTQMKNTLESLKITLNSMGNGYNRLNDEFSEIIKDEAYNMPENIYKYRANNDIRVIKKEPREQILKNLKQESISSVGKNTFKDKPGLSSIGRNTKDKTTPGGVSRIEINKDKAISDRRSPIVRNKFKDKIYPNINYSRRSDFSDLVGEPKMRCFCKHKTSYFKCYDDKSETNPSYCDLLK